MEKKISEEFRGLFARLNDLSEKASLGDLALTPFLSPRERYYAEDYLRRMGVRFRSFGGHAEAERCRLYLLPDYMEGDETETETLFSVYGFETGICALKIRGSGYRVLSHRDFLGALLGLGIERSVLGDLAVNEEGNEAILFCEVSIGSFIESEMTKAGSDKVRVIRLRKEEAVLPPRRFATVTDTVASPRLDSVVASLCGLSREKARQAVCAGLAEMNFESEDRPDRTVPSGALISVRGYGKYRVLSLEDRTKKGRFRLVAEKFL